MSHGQAAGGGGFTAIPIVPISRGGNVRTCVMGSISAMGVGEGVGRLNIPVFLRMAVPAIGSSAGKTQYPSKAFAGLDI